MIAIPRVLFPLAGLVLAAGAATVGARGWLGERAFDAGRTLQSRGELRRAGEAYRDAAALGNVDAAVARARLALARGDWETAADGLRAARRRSPARGVPHLLQARLEAARPGPWDAARDERVLGACRTAVSLEPARAEIWRGCAEVALRLALVRRPDWGAVRERAVRGGAAQDGAEALARAPSESRQTLSALLDAGADAAFVLDAAASCGSAPALGAAVGLLLDRGLWTAAQEGFWERGVGAGALPAFAAAAASAYLQRRLPREALDAAGRGRRADPADATLAALAADAAARLPGAEAREALPLYREALALAPEDRPLRRRFAALLAAHGQLAPAEAEARRVVEADPAGAEGWFLLGGILRSGGRPAEAAAAFGRAAALRPGNAAYRRAAGGAPAH